MSKHKTAKATTGKAGGARARLAAEQAAKEQRRRRMILVVVPIAVVLVAVLALVGARVLGIGKSNGDTVAGPTDGSVVSKATSVPAGVLNQVGIGTSTGKPKAIQAPALTEDGKPKILYVGAEYCPYCATERWAMVVALSRFGTFSNLGQTASSADDVYPSTATLSFHGSSYTSSTIAFTGVETQADQGVALDTLSAADERDRIHLQLPALHRLGRLDPVRRHRRQVPDQRRLVQPTGAAGQDPRRDRHGVVRSGFGDRQGGRRHRQHDHRRDLRDHRQRSGQRLHLGRGQGRGRQPVVSVAS